jgi:hypothetical protein
MTSDLTPSAAPNNINELRARTPIPPPRQGPHHTTGIAYLASEG